MSEHIELKLKIWRQKNKDERGQLVEYKIENVSTHASFLEMLDQLNEKLIMAGEDPVVFDHDCREGICGSCGFMINGQAHGPLKATTVCQLHMRNFENGATLTLEPWRASAFPIIKDLMVDRSAMERINIAGGFISVDTGNAQDANSLPVPKPDSDLAFASANCIQCGACVASCKNASAALFTGAKISHLSLLPQGKVERYERAERMIAQMDAEGFGACTTTGACSAACPKSISLSNIARMNSELFISNFNKKAANEGGEGL